MIRDFLSDRDNSYQGTVENIPEKNRCTVNIGSSKITAVSYIVIKVGDQVLVSRLDNQWAVISRIRNGGKTMEVRV
ncbi:MAG: hypothetical protein SFH39_00655 [Candidatus Magnetobacterium sp. LHC-1]|nr:hypothetical protein [Nitrospirota bacterium]